MVFGWFSKDKGGEDKRLSKAQKLHSQGRWAEALSYFDEILEADPASEEARKGARSCREKLVAANLEEARSLQASEPAKAAEHARLALELARGEPDLTRVAKDVVETIGGQQTPRPRAPSPAPVFTSPCSCATPCGETAPSEDPQTELDVEDLFAFYLESVDPQERIAFEPLGEAFREGYVLLQQGDLARAGPLLEQAAANEPRSPAPHHALGLLAGLGGNAAGAEACFRNALEIAPNFAPAARHRAEVLRELGRGKEALDLLAAWASAHPDDSETRLLLGFALLEAGDFEGARREAQGAAPGLPSGDPRPALLAARALRASGERAGALQALQGVLAQRPDLLEALVPLAELLAEQGGPSAERAAEAFKRCYQLDPDRGWWYLIKVAESYSARGWRAQALDVLERARSELPDTAEASEAWEAARATLLRGT